MSTVTYLKSILNSFRRNSNNKFS